MTIEEVKTDKISRSRWYITKREIDGEIRKLQLLEERRKQRRKYKKNREDKEKNDNDNE